MYPRKTQSVFVLRFVLSWQNEILMSRDLVSFPAQWARGRWRILAPNFSNSRIWLDAWGRYKNVTSRFFWSAKEERAVLSRWRFSILRLFWRLSCLQTYRMVSIQVYSPIKKLWKLNDRLLCWAGWVVGKRWSKRVRGMKWESVCKLFKEKRSAQLVKTACLWPVLIRKVVYFEVQVIQ